MCSISWATLASGSLTIGSQPTQLMRLQRRKAGYSLHGLPVIYDGPCGIAMLQNLPTGRCSHPTWRVTRWTHWPSLSSCWCNFLAEEEKEWNVQYRFIRALSDKELIKKLLALNLMATTSKMLEVCHTHIAISDNLEAMGLKDQRQSMPYKGKTNLMKGRNLQQTVYTHVDTAQSPTKLAHLHAQQRMSTAKDVEN